MKEIVLPLVMFVMAIALGSGVGNYATKKTGRKAVGWSIGIIVFFALMAVSGAML